MCRDHIVVRGLEAALERAVPAGEVERLGYTERDERGEEVIRIIAARKANRYERGKFRHGIFDRLGLPGRSD
jgi:uncharacterized DUF497 family protein